MNRILLLISTIILSIGLVACSSSDDNFETEEMKVGDVDISDEDEEEEENQDEEIEVKGVQTSEDEDDDEEDVEVIKEFNETIVNEDDFAIQLENVEKTEDVKYEDDKIEINFKVKNKRDHTILIDSGEVSADGKMVDPYNAYLSSEVAGKKKADATLKIQNRGGDLPKIEEDLELVLNIRDPEDYDYREEIFIQIDLTPGVIY